MLSKSEAISRLKKMGMTTADDQSIVTVILPPDVPFYDGVKDIKDKLKSMDYQASFSIRQRKGLEEKQTVDEAYDEEDADIQDASESSLFSMDDDGQFTLDGISL